MRRAKESERRGVSGLVQFPGRPHATGSRQVSLQCCQVPNVIATVSECLTVSLTLLSVNGEPRAPIPELEKPSLIGGQTRPFSWPTCELTHWRSQALEKFSDDDDDILNWSLPVPVHMRG